MITWCFNGWAQPSDGLAEIAPHARHIAYSDYAPKEFWSHLPHESPDVLIGWSLGGQLAVRAVLEAGLCPRALVLLGTPWRFVAAPDWPQGMGRSTYDLFRENYATQPERTARRFAQLVAQGDTHSNRIAAEQATHWDTMSDRTRWLPWLDDLAAWMPGDVSALPPALIVHGAGDRIVASAQAAQWESRLMQSKLHLWDECGHAPHLHDAPRLRALIERWSAVHA